MTKGKTTKKKAKWQNGQGYVRIMFGEKEIQRTQIYEKMFNINHNNRNKNQTYNEIPFSTFQIKLWQLPLRKEFDPW